MTCNTISILDLSVKIIGGLTAFILFIIGFKRYRRDQDWKVLEFVAKEIKDFNSDPQNRKAMMMLDWWVRKIELFPMEEVIGNKFVIVTYEIMAGALVHHSNKPGGKFTPEEAEIRDIFDHFLSDIDRFYRFIEAGLVKSDEFKPYLQYWVDKISHGVSPGLKSSILEFIVGYKYTGVKKLFESMGLQFNE